MRPPRDPDIAVREEYRAAQESGTVEALTLFIKRHPRHELAEEARQKLEEIEDR